MTSTNNTPPEQPDDQQPADEGLDDAICSAWTPVTERLPKVGRRVLVCLEYGENRRHITIASWQPAQSIDANYWEEYPEDWEEEDGDIITNPTDLWLENPLEVEQCGFVENVTHWMDLPSLPNGEHVHPLPDRMRRRTRGCGSKYDQRRKHRRW